MITLDKNIPNNETLDLDADSIKPFNEIRSDIKVRFDFEKVHEAMIKLDLKWLFGNELRIPTLHEIETCAYSLCKSLYETDTSNVMTGGFRAYKKEKSISLIFAIQFREVQLTY